MLSLQFVPQRCLAISLLNAVSPHLRSVLSPLTLYTTQKKMLVIMQFYMHQEPVTSHAPALVFSANKLLIIMLAHTRTIHRLVDHCAIVHTQRVRVATFASPVHSAKQAVDHNEDVHSAKQAVDHNAVVYTQRVCLSTSFRPCTQHKTRCSSSCSCTHTEFVSPTSSVTVQRKPACCLCSCTLTERTSFPILCHCTAQTKMLIMQFHTHREDVFPHPLSLYSANQHVVYAVVHSQRGRLFTPCITVQHKPRCR